MFSTNYPVSFRQGAHNRADQDIYGTTRHAASFIHAGIDIDYMSFNEDTPTRETVEKHLGDGIIIQALKDYMRSFEIFTDLGCTREELIAMGPLVVSSAACSGELHSHNNSTRRVQDKEYYLGKYAIYFDASDLLIPRTDDDAKDLEFICEELSMQAKPEAVTELTMELTRAMESGKMDISGNNKNVVEIVSVLQGG